MAIKVLEAGDDEHARRRFARELAVVLRLGSHPHIVQVFDAGATAGGQPYVAMELYDQGSLSDRLTRGGPMGVAEVLDVGVKICSAVQAAHDAGILHRDIKPQNILLSDYGPALADFGVARASGTLERSQALSALTPWHAAPECFLDDTVTAAADVYSLGSTLFTLLAGRSPFAGPADEPIGRYQARLATTPVPKVPRPDVPPEVQAVLERALAKDPGQRYASAAELGAALRRVQLLAAAAVATPAPVRAAPTSPTADPELQATGAGETILRPGTLRPPPPPPPPEPRPGRARLAAVATGGAVLLVATVAVVVVLAGGHGGRATPAPTRASLSPPAPATGPTSFTAVPTGTAVDLSWADHSNGTARYFLAYRSVDGPQQGPLAVDPGGTSYEVTSLDPAQGYCFRLLAQIPEVTGTAISTADASVRGCVAATPAPAGSP